MKKFAFIVSLLLSFSNVFAGNEFEAPAMETVQEIILTEVYNIMPLDDSKDDEIGRHPDPTRFHAFINGNLLLVGSYTNVPAYVEVIDQETGEVVADEEFEGETEISVEDAGSYIVQIYSGNSVMTGEFEVE